MRRRVDSKKLPLLIVLIGFLGCSKGDATKTDSAGTAARPLVGAAMPKVLPGALSKAFAEFTPDEFLDFASKLTGSGGVERTRNCVNANGCGPGGTRTTKVFIEAIATQDSLGPSTVPRFGVIYGRIANRGDAQEARYGFLPGAQYQYYMLITPDSAKGMTWHIIQVDAATGAHKLSEIGTGAFKGCNHPWKAGARADFKTCQQSASMHDSIVHLGLALQSGEDPAWFGCDSGCCYADNT